MARLLSCMGFALALWTPLAANAVEGMCVEPTLERLVSAGDEAEPALRARLPLEDKGDVPWCASPDDSRCAPLPAAPEPTRVEGRAPINAVSETGAADHWPCGEARVTPRVGLSRATGVTLRLERPPRAHRRTLG